jgi:hypothetical protein
MEEAGRNLKLAVWSKSPSQAARVAYMVQHDDGAHTAEDW